MQTIARRPDLMRIGELPSGRRDRRTVAFAAVTSVFAAPLGLLLVLAESHATSEIVGAAVIAMLVVLGSAGVAGPRIDPRRTVNRGIGLVGFVAIGAASAPAIAGWLST